MNFGAPPPSFTENMYNVPSTGSAPFAAPSANPNPVAPMPQPMGYQRALMPIPPRMGYWGNYKKRDVLRSISCVSIFVLFIVVGVAVYFGVIRPNEIAMDEAHKDFFQQ